MRERLIILKNFYKIFPKAPSPILKNIQLEVSPQEVVGIIGESGSGKTTLLRCLTGLEKPSSGEIWVEGENITAYTDKDLLTFRKKLGMVFQQFHLFSSRTVAQNIEYPLEIHRFPTAKRKERVKELLSLVGLENKEDCYPATLSGGEKQRVCIARALATGPSLLLCDEPTSALDPKTSASIIEMLDNLQKKLGLTMVIISHRYDVLQQLCTRTLQLCEGELEEVIL